MRLIRGIVYRLGLRPRPGSIFYSPSLALIYAIRDADIPGAFARGIERQRGQ
ncbi:hypothetical protein SEA_CASSIA_27 [Arthrobacter phage Cassia]|uniref:Uncharacterized protein n=1 Tax=Arthrobacter phage Cassia TaxID=2927275 RepID=A0AAF0K165_9CAUD|nr:hypothetical protein SEA_CASSIA_27 [Arthrobacter phage Cassia]